VNPTPESLSPPASAASDSPRDLWTVHLLTLLGLIIFSVLTGFWSYYRQVSTWQFWDDEGYVMVTVSRFLQGKPLYTDVFSQYGPAYYLFQWLALLPASHRVTHDAIRVETLFFWGYCAFLSGLTAYRLTRSPLAAFAAHLQVSMILNQLTFEPGHPQGLCLFFLVNAMFGSTFFRPDRKRRNAAVLVGIGFCIGSLIAIKVNIGVYLGLAAVLTLLLLSPPTRLWNVIASIAGPILLVGFAGLLLRNSVGLGWVQSLALSVVVGGILALGVARFVWVRSHAPGAPILGERFSVTGMIMPAVIGAATGIAVPIVFVLLRGTSPADLWSGMVGQHIGFDTQFMIPIGGSGPWMRSGVTTSVVFLAIIGGIFTFTERHRLRTDQAAAKANSLELIPLLILAVSALRFYLGYQGLLNLAIGLEGRYFLSLLPALWLVLVPQFFTPLPDTKTVLTQFLPRVLLVLTAILEGLWVYPVAGSQLYMASLLPAILTAVLLADGVSEAGTALTRLAASRSKAPEQTLANRKPTLGISALFGVGMFLFGVNHYREVIADERAAYAQNVPLNLPGSSLIRLPPERAAALRSVTQYLRDNSDTIVMLPGMYSFYFWLERNPPTGDNAGAWPILFSDVEQAKMVAVYRERAKTGRLVGLYGSNALNIWLNPQRHAQDETQKPLFRYIATEFAPAAQFGDLILLKPRTAAEGSVAK
jgi:hypothetical protein